MSRSIPTRKDFRPYRQGSESVNTLYMTWDGNGMEVLSRSDCLQFLGQVHMGRISVSMGALPVVLPVNFALFDGDILIRVARGSRLDAAATDAVVAFEIDGVDALLQTGWSVLVQGMAQEITDKDELNRAKAVPLSPWAGPDDRVLRVSAEIVSGRRLTTAVGVDANRLADAVGMQ